MQDQFVGTWKLNVAKSEFDANHRPTAATMVFELDMVKDGLNPELLLGGKYGHKLDIWDLDKRRLFRKLT